jgi:hypothetical protein
MRLLEDRSERAGRQAGELESQLAFFERPKAVKRGKETLAKGVIT